jgi:putative sterol carrier protein
MFDNETWLTDTVASTNNDKRFTTATTEFDGSIALEMGSDITWLKVYRGEIIDTEPYVPSFGATFRLVGDEDAWHHLAANEMSLSEALYNGSLRTAGNKVEANRMRDALELFVRHLQTATSESEVEA